MRSTGPQPPPLQSESGDSRRHQSCRSEGGTTAGEFLKPIMWPIIRSTPDARPGTAPDEKTEMRYPTRASEPAHRRLRSCLLLCTIHQCKNFTMCPRGDGKPCAVYLTGDIRMGWSGRAPAPPVSEAGRGRQSQGAHAMSEKPNSAIAVIGIDIGKNSFHLVGQDRRVCGLGLPIDFRFAP